MKRFAMPRVFFVAALAILLFVDSAGAGRFNIARHTLRPTMERVKVGFSPTYPLGCAGITGCSQIDAVIRVTPCPPDVSCTGGTYVLNLDSFSDYEFVDLALGQTYTFEGSFKRQVGSTVNPCVYTCVYEQAIESMTHQAVPAGGLAWDISPVGSNEDTVWVDFRLLRPDPNPNPCIEEQCVVQQIFFNISPCPLLLDGEPSCSGHFDAWPDTYRVALAHGLTYTFSGWFDSYGLSRGQFDFCEETTCGYREYPADAQFTASTLAVIPTTWGRIKALYRD